MGAGSLRAVAIDGPAGAGKSTVARAVADALGYQYVDTGAMYRAVTLAALRAGADLASTKQLARVARETRLSFSPDGARIFLGEEDVTDQIRAPEVTAKTRYAARSDPVREELVGRQRAMAAKGRVVMEGRDITTVVLPDARWKFFLDASPTCRAERRRADLERAGQKVSAESVLEEIASRDRSDYERRTGPLRRVADQVYLDTSELTVDQVVDFIVEHVRHDCGQ